MSQSSPSLLDHPVIGLHREICSIESITGNENEVGEYLVSYLQGKGFTVEKQAVPSNFPNPRFNVLAYLGDKRNTRVCLTSHIDVVPPYWPYKLSEDGQTISGRGTVDAKACVAAMTIAAEDLISQSLIQAGDVSLLFVVGEEVNCDGMFHANDLGITWESVIFGEPTEGTLPGGHKGFTGVDISVTGKAAHSGYPELGDSATEKLLVGLAAIQRLDLPQSDLFGKTTINIGRIDAGVAANVIPFTADAKLSFRIAGGTIEDFQNLIEDTLKATGYDFKVSFTRNSFSPVKIDCDVPGFETRVVNYGTDVPNLKGSHKRYLYGPGSIHVAHTENEALKVAELVDSVKAYQKLTLHCLGAR